VDDHNSKIAEVGAAERPRGGASARPSVGAAESVGPTSADDLVPVATVSGGKPHKI
jgi:hypothetical protein